MRRASRYIAAIVVFALTCQNSWAMISKTVMADHHHHPAASPETAAGVAGDETSCQLHRHCVCCVGGCAYGLIDDPIVRLSPVTEKLSPAVLLASPAPVANSPYRPPIAS